MEGHSDLSSKATVRVVFGTANPAQLDGLVAEAWRAVLKELNEKAEVVR
jgi:hypothetical protein